MRRSTERFRISHAGALPRGAALEEIGSQLPATAEEFDALLPGCVAQVVRDQREAGVDCVNDGEVSKMGGFSTYMRSRLTGLQQRPWEPGERPERGPTDGRERRIFRGFYTEGPQVRRALWAQRSLTEDPLFAVEPVKYVGYADVERDIANLQSATKSVDVEVFLSAVGPATLEHWLWNQYYSDVEAFLLGIAEALHEEYRVITDAGIILQVDEPGLLDTWEMFSDMDVQEYRHYAEMRVEILNEALKGIPEEQVRIHLCWGSNHGPHTQDIPLKEVLDVLLKAHVQCLGIEASNPRHEHEWQVWEDVGLPDGKLLMPGVIGHATDIVEHPELVAQRLVRYADAVGRENVLAGTDCGMGVRVGHPEICWAKLRALSEGAQLASARCWN